MIVFPHVVSLIYDSTKMYKRRIKQWGLDKNNKDDEMRAVVRKTKARLDQGKQSKIHVRGKAIGDEEIIRYWKRKGISIDDVIARRAASGTPEAVEIVTPVPSRVATPTSFAVPERIFAAIRDYFESSFASGNWVYDDPESLCHTFKVQEDTIDDLNGLMNHTSTACRLFSNHRYQEAGRILISLTSKLQKILSAEHPHTLGNILSTITTTRSEGRDEIGIAVLRQFCALGEFVVGKEHPLRLVCGWLASADAFQFDEIIARCLQSVTDQLESFIGPMHFSTLISRTEYIHRTVSAKAQREELLQSLLGQCELRLGSSDVRTHLLRHQVARYYLDDGQHAEALRVGQDLIAYAQHGQPPNRIFDSHYASGLYIVAISRWALGQTFLAETNLREAIALQISERGTRDSLVGHWLVNLEQLLVEMGRWSCAAEVQETRMGMLDPTEVL